ncbi:hypothetical protein PENDEC_c002G01695 [Penicillium decumbens]|uniref:Uncharacterized protein n=1 Tax=Penicillium decumbens TaxID=69771 RepID=A0A1V6PLE6_PENDC|nr:hypothetical protein PENDEC_c002G01695 [Penicillium decumbens]
MEQCELPSFQPESIADDDLGLTLSPGSQSQLPELWLQDENAFDFDIDIGPDFDPFTDFGQLVPQLDESNKRTHDGLDDLFEEECIPPESKKQKTGEQQLSPAVAEVLNIETTNEASILPHAAPDSCATPSASSAVQQKFCLGQQDIAYHASVEAMLHKPDSKHVSPYGSVGYRPSAPGLHSMRSVTEASHETLQYRLSSSRRRIDVLTAERNRYRDALLKYTSIDPKTGRLGIHVQEAEMATLRRVCTTQQQRAKSFKTEIEEWKGKFVKLAQTHNSLIRDFQQCTSGAAKPNASNEWENRYNQSSHAYNDLLSTCAQLNPSIQVEPVEQLRQSGQRPQLNSPCDQMEPIVQHSAPLNTNISYPSPPTSTSPILLEDLTPRPPLNPSIHSSAASPIVLDDLTPQQPSNSPIHSSTSSTLVEDLTPRPPPNSPILSSTPASLNMNNNTVLAIGLAHGPTAATAPPMNSAANFCHSHAVSPKEAEVIDLIDLTTDDPDAEKVSTQGITPVQNADSPLTKFRREFRKKDLKWLHQVNDHDAVDDVFNNLNPDRKNQVYKKGLGLCYNLVETQKHIRRNLGGPFNDPTNDLLVSASAALQEHVAVKSAAVRSAVRSAARSAAKSAAQSAAKSTNKTTMKTITKTTNKVTTKTVTKTTTIPECHAPAAIAAAYNPTDDEFGRMIEDDMLQEMMDREADEALV